MSKLTEYTIEVYKCDRRVKGSYRLIEKKDFYSDNEEESSESKEDPIYVGES